MKKAKFKVGQIVKVKDYKPNNIGIPHYGKVMEAYWMTDAKMWGYMLECTTYGGEYNFNKLSKREAGQ